MPPKTNRFYSIVLLFIFLALFSGWFYWFQWRPAQIRSKCQIGLAGKEDLSKISGDSINLEVLVDFEKITDSVYLNCLNKHGLKE